MSSLDPVEVRLLGPVLVRRGDGTTVRQSEWRTAKAVELLRLLALCPTRFFDADALTEELWPGTDPERARASLRTAVYHLRRVLGDAHLIRHGTELALDDVWVDATVFEELVVQADGARRAGLHAETVRLCRAADALYVGDLETREAAPRLAQEADRLRALRRRLLLQAAESALALGWMRSALDLTDRCVVLDPHSERVARVQMRAFAGIGEMRAAHAAYERLRHDLRRDVGVEPSPQTRATRGALTESSVGAPSTPRPADDAGELTSALSAAMQHPTRGGVVLLVGDRGSGRRRLVSEAVHALGLTLRSADPADLEVHESETTLASSGQVTGRDVLQLPEAEGLTRAQLSWYVRLALGRAAVLLLPTTSMDSTLLTDLPLEVALVRVPLADVADLERLAASVLHASPAPTLVERLDRESGGLTGRARELLVEWLTSETVVWTPDGLDVRAPDTDPLPMNALISRRLGSDAGEVLDVLCVVAMAETGLTADDVGRVLRAARPDTDRTIPFEPAHALARLLDVGVLTLGPLGYRFARAEHRDELLGWLRPSRRARLYAAVAQEVPVDTHDRVRHLMAAGRLEQAAELGGAALTEARLAGAQDEVHEWERLLDRLPHRLRPGDAAGPLVARVVTARMRRGLSVFSMSPVLSHRVHGELEMALLRALGAA